MPFPTDDLGFLDRSDRVRLAVTGPDRAKFLHNLTTNDVKRLAIGRGCEAFITSPQGKTLGYVSLLACDDRILVRTDPGGLSQALAHLQKYGVFDDVALDDMSERTFEFHLAGLRADALLSQAGCDLPEDVDLCHRMATFADRSIRIVRESPTGYPGLTLIGDRADADAVRAALHPMGLHDVSPATFEALRIEAGTPIFGQDVTPDNLPQEIGRDDRAINFVKGCYLGQETVARIDALGHVNKILKGLRLEGGAVPSIGSIVEADGKKIGAVTSSAFSPGLGGPIALAIVRTSHAQAGTHVIVRSEAGEMPAVVSDLPLRPAIPILP